MTIRILLTTAAFGLAACNSNNAADNAMQPDNAALADNGADANATAATTAPATGSDFANMVAASDHYEIEAGKLAATKASSADVKSFGQMLVTAHQQSTAELKTAASQASPPMTPSDALDGEKQGMLDALQSASGADFDRLFIDQQLTAHEKALSLVQTYAAGGDTDILRTFATKAATVIQDHLDKARALKK